MAQLAISWLSNRYLIQQYNSLPPQFAVFTSVTAADVTLQQKSRAIKVRDNGDCSIS